MISKDIYNRRSHEQLHLGPVDCLKQSWQSLDRLDRVGG